MTSQHPPEHFIAYLLLRDGHTVPIQGLDPESLKRARKATLQYGNIPLKHLTGLNAIVDCLGFDGDFGTYKREHWPKLSAFLERHGMRERVDLFVQRSEPYIGFNLFWGKRRALADRIFSSGYPQERLPTRAFTGYGFDWDEFGPLYAAGTPNPRMWKPAEPGVEFTWEHREEFYESQGQPPVGMEETKQWLYSRTLTLNMQHSYMSNHLLEVARREQDVPMLYGAWEETAITPPGKGHPDLTVYQDEETLEAFKVLRWYLMQRPEGWVTVHRYNDNLVIIEGPGGAYDLLWRNLRTKSPPTFESNKFGEETHFDTWYYYQQGRWKERDEHEANHHFYRAHKRDYPGESRLLMEYFASTDEYNERRMPHRPSIGLRFTPVAVEDRGELWVSDLITKVQFERFLTETGHREEMRDEARAMHEAANWQCKDGEPVGVNFHLAKAFCDWLEGKHDIPVRLMTHEEHRLIRPFALGLDGSERYKMLSNMDFPWERFPPRERLPSGLVWSTERFKEPDEDTPEFLEKRVYFGKRPSRKIWLTGEDWPPKAKLSQDATRAAYEGIEFIDAWDVYEWCMRGWIMGRYWEGPFGLQSWGEYKNCRVNFRVVVPKGGAR